MRHSPARNPTAVPDPLPVRRNAPLPEPLCCLLMTAASEIRRQADQGIPYPTQNAADAQPSKTPHDRLVQRFESIPTDGKRLWTTA